MSTCRPHPKGKFNLKTQNTRRKANSPFRFVLFFESRVTFDTMANRVKSAQPPTFDQSTATDKSAIMNALAMKYLPIEQQHHRQQSSPNRASPATNQVTLTQTMTTAAVAAYNTTPTTNQHNSPSDMSIASYRYMEKYGLL